MSSYERPHIDTIPTEVIVEIFYACPSILTARALSQTSSRLYQIFKSVSYSVHLKLVGRLFSPHLNHLRLLSTNKSILPKTQDFLESIACALYFNEMMDMAKKLHGGDVDAARESFPLYFKEWEGMDEVDDETWYAKLSVEALMIYWDLYTRLFPCDVEGVLKEKGLWKKEYEKPEIGGPGKESKKVEGCETCKGEFCEWHEQLEVDRVVFDQIEVYQKAEPKTRRQWDAFLQYLVLYAESCFPVPEKYEPEWKGSKCKKGVHYCDACSRLPDGGLHLWDYSTTELLRQEMIEMLDRVEEQIEAEDVYLFEHPYECRQTFTGYWKGLKEFTEVDKVTGRLVDVEGAKKKYFAEANTDREYDEVEMMVETVKGKKKRKVVVDREEWEHVVEQMKALDEAHR